MTYLYICDHKGFIRISKGATKSKNNSKMVFTGTMERHLFSMQWYLFNLTNDKGLLLIGNIHNDMDTDEKGYLKVIGVDLDDS